MSEVTLLVALLSGTLALLSPCSALLLPSFFAYAFTSRTQLVARTVAFYVGLLLTLVPLGMGAGLASQVLYGHRPTLILVVGWSLIVLGTFQALGGRFSVPGSALLQGWVGTRSPGQGTGTGGVMALGAVYGLAGFCSGPVLGAILTLAATTSPLGGGVLLAAYALGMAAPLFVLAAGWDRLDLGRRRWVRGRAVSVGPVRTHTTSLLAGALFIAIGVLFLVYDGTAGITGSLGLSDTTDLESSAQVALTQWTSQIPSWLVPALVALGAAWIGWRRRTPDREPQPEAAEGRRTTTTGR